MLITGGDSYYGTTNSTELYDSATGTFTTTGSMNGERQSHAAALLANGNVLITGGLNNPGYDRDIHTYLASGEVYDSASGAFFAVGNMGSARINHTVTPLPDGRALIAGGNMNGAISAELYQ